MNMNTNNSNSESVLVSDDEESDQNDSSEYCAFSYDREKSSGILSSIPAPIISLDTISTQEAVLSSDMDIGFDYKCDTCPDACEMKDDVSDQHIEFPSASKDLSSSSFTLKDPEKSPSIKKVFHVNTRLIQESKLTEQDDELQQLGINVFNQEQFEEGVIAQVDHAMAEQEQKRVEKNLKKELKCVGDDISLVNDELNQIDKVLSLMKPDTANNSKDVKIKQESVLRQKENKLKHLIKIRAKEKSLLTKLHATRDNLDDDNNEDTTSGVPSILERSLRLGHVQHQETEQERLTRMGEMTPFGTKMSFSEPTPSTTQNILKTNSPTQEMTDFEKYLFEMESKTSTKKSKINVKKNSVGQKSSKTVPLGKAAFKKSHDNFFDKKSKFKPQTDKVFHDMSWKTRHPSLKHSFSGDGQLSDYEAESDSGQLQDGEYLPDNDELQNNESNESDSCFKRKKNREYHIKSKKIKLNESIDDEGDDDDDPRDDDDDPRGAGTSLLKCRDDGNREEYVKRLKLYRKRELKLKHEKILAGEYDTDGEAEFEGGFKIPFGIWNKLYRYQKTCVKWLWELHCQQVGGIVGDEMGLGKTVQMISFLAGLKQSGLRNKGFRFTGLGPVIIVCPTTVMHQWVREFHEWHPDFRVAILHSTGTYTGSVNNLIHSIVNCCGVLITSYQGLAINQDLLTIHKWHYVILDEGHKIRNPDAQATLACKQIRTPHRVILSGSPIQNNLKELWSLFDFIFPGKLGTLPDFMQHFSVPIVQGGYSNATDIQVQTAYKCSCVLRDTISPYLLRRMKVDVKVNLQLPDKTEQVLFCRLTEDQKEVYKEYLNSRECQSILAGNYMVFPGLITLRKMCNHPDLSTGGLKFFNSDYDGNSEVSRYGYFKRSGKMIVIESLLKIWSRQGHRVLLFSQSRQMLDILEDFTQQQKYSYMRMDGGTSIGSRQSLINKFNGDDSIFVFLLTTKVGGLGVNLTGANRVIIFDPDWNPSTDLQARERAWRIGQKRQVTIYRLLTTGTIEEKIYHRQIFKQFLTNRVLKDPKQRRFFKSNDLHELFTLTNEDNRYGTETSALFAGTGSDVRVQLPKNDRRPNRFDEMKKRGEMVKNAKGVESTETDSETEDVKATFSEAKLEKMRQFAKQLSQKLAKVGNISNASLADAKMKKNKRSRKERKHKKKTRQDAEFEGEVVSNLDRHENITSNIEKTRDKTSQDDYVLQKLLKKSGVHSALRHDAIMDSSCPDYALVDAEAERVAKQASNALKASRLRCLNATAGIPTWTGSSGKSGAPGVKLKKFGSKKNSKITGFTPSNLKTNKERPPESAERNPFEGIKSGHSTTLSTTSLTKSTETTGTPSAAESASLLSNMRKRNYGLEISNSANEAEVSGSVVEDVDPANQELIEDLRSYVAFQGSIMDGQATTQDILQRFGNRLPSPDSAKFKAMLNQICTFQRMGGIGLWTLKDEFR